MKRGELAKKKRKGCLTALLVVWAVFMVKVIAVLNPGFPTLRKDNNLVG